MQIQKKSILFVAITALLFSGCSLFKHPQGGLKIMSDVPAQATLDAKAIGTTPLDKSPLDVKKYDLLLAPQDSSLASHTLSVRISDGFLTTVDWHFGSTDDASSGSIYESEDAQRASAAELEIVTTPDNVPVTINNQNKGFSPLVIDTLPPGSYGIDLQAPGFDPISKTVNLSKGKRLIVTVKLARQLQPPPTQTATDSGQLQALPTDTPAPTKSTKIPTPTASASASLSSGVLKTTSVLPYVKVLHTTIGFLRVRKSADVNSDEVARLAIGSTVPYLNASTSGWFQIKYDSTISGWISSQFSKLYQ